MMRELIALLSKEGNRSKLTNMWPITLLNITYKIFAKALQRQLRALLVEVIDSVTCFSFASIHVGQIMLTHESILWAKESRQEFIFLELDFSNRVN